MTEPLKYTSDGVPKNWNGKDWQQYKWAMMIVFRKKKLVDVVDGAVTRDMLTSAETEADFDDRQLTIMQLIGMSLPADIFHQVRDKTTGTDMWKALCVIYESRANKTTMAHRAESIRHELEMLKLAPGGDVNKHLSKMFNLRTELLSLNYQFDDITMVELMLNSLPHQYEFESLKSGVRYNSADNFITPERTRELIRVADSRQKAYQVARGGQRVGPKTGGNGVEGNKPKTEEGQQHGNKTKDWKKKRVKKCYICDSTEHLRSDCPQKAKGSEGGGAHAAEQKRKPRANMTTRREDNESGGSSSEDEEANEATSLLDTLLLDAGTPDDVQNDEPGSTSDAGNLVDDQDDGISDGESDHEETESINNSRSSWWYFDTAANVHVTGNPLDYVTFTPDSHESQHVQGVTPALASRIAGVGTVELITNVDGEQAVVYLNDVFFVPGATHGLLSIGLAAEQGFDFDYYPQVQSFRVREDGRTVIVATPHDATWGFQVTHPMSDDLVAPPDGPLCNFTAAEGVASMKVWHERLGHTCSQYLKMMVDKDLVRGMMLRRRELGACDACHIGKQKQRAHRKKLNRNIMKPNQVVYADLLIPSKDNGTKYEAVLVNETMASITMDLEGGEACAAPSAVPTRTAQRHVELSEMRATTCKASTADLGGITAALPSVETRAHTPADVSSAQTEAQQVSTGHQSEELAGTDVQHENLGLPIGSEASMEMKTDQSLQPVLQSEDGNETGCSASELCDGSESVVSVCGTAADDAELIAEDEEPANEDDDETVVASVCGKIMGKRRRDETPSEEIRVELSAAKQEPKRKRTGLREYHERKKPAYFEDYVMNVAQRTTRILGKNGRPIRGSDVRIPKNRRAALRSKYCNFFCEAELEEMAALKARHVLEEIMYEDVPEGAKPIKTKWVYDTKTDSQGYVIRFKARLVALGNYQRPGIDFHDTFSPVARMSSFRLMVGLAAELDLKLFGGDINTAYLNADLGIKQYVSSIEGFPCEIDGHIYVVKKALYGLRQSGREWNSELNQWMLDHGYQRSMTEPCLYFRLEGDMTMLVLVYVDDILVATNAEEEKNKLFEDLDKEYGIKDQGLLKHYLGVEVEQTDECVIIRQRKYAHEIVEKFGYGEAHPVGNPME
ncbi:hypothetical protein PR003_g29050, partial [Phytophthora rubi]